MLCLSLMPQSKRTPETDHSVHPETKKPKKRDGVLVDPSPSEFGDKPDPRTADDKDGNEEQVKDS